MSFLLFRYFVQRYRVNPQTSIGVGGVERLSGQQRRMKKKKLTISITDPMRIYVEIKIFPTTAADILRQIGTYRDYISSADAWRDSDYGYRGKAPFVLATKQVFLEDEVDMLERELIYWVHLGEEFEAWYKEKTSKPAKKARVCL
jgi:hypothetical protein